MQGPHRGEFCMARDPKSYYIERIIPEETKGALLVSHIKRYSFAKQFCEDKIVLDAACGVGYGSHYIAEVAQKVIGVDISKQAIAYAKSHYQKENVVFRVMDIHNLEFPDSYFDLVCSFETIEHIDEIKKFLSEVKRVLKRNGKFIVSTPRARKTNYDPKNPYHKTEFSYSDFQSILEEYFNKVQLYGQRRVQSSIHYYLQLIDIFNLRSKLPSFVRRKGAYATGTKSCDELDLDDFVINEEKLDRAFALVAVCLNR
jgi:ubiquinone/menaquinone biosynthesis C-methylase UbiE